MLRPVSAPPVAVTLPESQAVSAIDYQRDVRPIFEQKCIACHACYDAPCQLKLSSHAGVARGASKQLVYDGTRTEDAEPNRLYTDADTEQGWRQRGFYSVLDSQHPQAALMARMLALGRQEPWEANARLPDSLDISIKRDNQCAGPDEFDTFAARHPAAGMPFAVTGLTDDEYRILLDWLAQGASVPEQQAPLSASLERKVRRWEHWLNRSDNRHRLVARYLYEHWFLAHLYFEDDQDQMFFELVRSRTPSGEPVDVIATVRPTDGIDGDFYYRLRPRLESRVHKTHITYPLSQTKMKRLERLFLEPDWAVTTLPGYGPAQSANPFVTFAAIPARARYQYLLDNAEYFVRTFIRGPVCRGQIATDVIRDQFWVSFQAPGHDLFVTDATHRNQVQEWLSLPGLKSDLLSLGPDWLAHREARNRYLAARQQDYARIYPEGPALDHLWNGDGHNRDALLTIFRHHDSASVVRGWQGDVPTTLWVMDYPLLERTYYALVANFNVYGSVSHQAQTRLYFDLIRNGAEANLLRFLPAEVRNRLLHHWYDNSARIKLFTTYADVDETTPSRIAVATQAPLADFSRQVLAALASVAGPPERLNRCQRQTCAQAEYPVEQEADAQLRRLTGVTAAALPSIKWLPEVSLLRIEAGDRRLVYSLLHNRDHSNVAFMLGEDLRLRPHNDTLTVLPGIVGSYPNFIFNVKLEELDDFVAALMAMARAEDIHTLARHFGIRRTHPEFWSYFHDMHRYLQETTPLEAGLLDMNRYLNL
ncbi:peptidylprolyl isomerase [Zobellella endophytica]|uniref:Peptidylprolyl isomerase n=2 Tax=Zobellella endophytica TaxID=2116700 RepID=A0A2P7RDI1_9GAMM|nr:peptidylprolyl isomerase [Zobellella endophytica]